MQSKISLKWSFSIIGIAGITFSLIIFIIIFFLGLPDMGSSSQTPRNLISGKSVIFPEQVSLGLPIRLKIPKINVNAAVEYVGLTPNGAMDVPKITGEVAWFDLGSRPGENGSAVIAGHYGRLKNGTGSVFDNLSKLHKGDKLYIQDDRGVTTAFVVVDSRNYDPNADASSVFGSNDGKAHLNLITCEGVWNKTQKSYSKRLVVFTDKEMEQ